MLKTAFRDEEKDQWVRVLTGQARGPLFKSLPPMVGMATHASNPITVSQSQVEHRSSLARQSSQKGKL